MGSTCADAAARHHNRPAYALRAQHRTATCWRQASKRSGVAHDSVWAVMFFLGMACIPCVIIVIRGRNAVIEEVRVRRVTKVKNAGGRPPASKALNC